MGRGSPWLPPRITRVPFASLAPLIDEVLAAGGQARLRVEGDSMRPWLAHGEDEVLLSSPGVRAWSRGDIVLMSDPAGRYVLHRVSRRSRGLVWLLGDAQTREEGPWRDDQVIALVERVVRRGREIDMRSPGARCFAGLWLACRPIRLQLLRMIGRAGRMRQSLKGWLSCGCG